MSHKTENTAPEEDPEREDLRRILHGVYKHRPAEAVPTPDQAEHDQAEHDQAEQPNQAEQPAPVFYTEVWHSKDGRAHIEVPAKRRDQFPAGTTVRVEAVE